MLQSGGTPGAALMGGGPMMNAMMGMPTSMGLQTSMMGGRGMGMPTTVMSMPNMSSMTSSMSNPNLAGMAAAAAGGMNMTAFGMMSGKSSSA
mmetsp:Transcript_46062/g.128138  ORF Transcript_46062/g.128138 Transcript_46062/m.128138 type:complete len:92 (+) Transcript_46062:188-463(+)